MQQKICFKCGEAKSADQFYRHPMMADGRLNKCKQCARSDVRRNRAERADKYRQYEKARAMDPKRVAGRRAYLNSEPGQMARRRALENYKRNHPEKRAAHCMVNNAVRKGYIQRRSCEVCGAIKADAHHEDYSRPLEVQWLCRQHHAEAHRVKREAEAYTLVIA